MGTGSSINTHHQTKLKYTVNNYVVFGSISELATETSKTGVRISGSCGNISPLGGD